LPSHLRCRCRHHRPTPTLLLWTMATIDDDNAVRPKNMPWNWPRPSIGTTAKAKERRRSAGKTALATTTTPPALRSDDGTILDCAARARALPSPRRRRCRGGQGQQRRRRQQRDPDSCGSGEVNPLDSTKRAYRPRREGEGGGTTRQQRMMMATTAALSRNGAKRGWGGC
jgi:hypothetical protein